LADVSVERVPPERLLSELVGEVVDVWTAAHGLPEESPTRREF
jgi:hypothetical protein